MQKPNKRTAIIVLAVVCPLFFAANLFAADCVNIVVPTGSSPSWTLQHQEIATFGKTTKCSSKYRTHVGIDIFGADTSKGGDPIFPFADGEVVGVCLNKTDPATGCSKDFGYAVKIRHPGFGPNGKDVYSIYLHLAGPPLVQSGRVTAGITQIGTIGNTGSTNGAYHVHFEIRYFSTWVFNKWGNIYCCGNCIGDPDISANWENPQNTSLCAISYDNPDAIAISDMNARAASDSRFRSVIVESFGKNLNWDTNWELRWIDFNFSGARVVRIYHATYTSDSTIRYTIFWDPDTENWTDWVRAE